MSPLECCPVPCWSFCALKLPRRAWPQTPNCQAIGAVCQRCHVRRDLGIGCSAPSCTSSPLPCKPDHRIHLLSCFELRQCLWIFSHIQNISSIVWHRESPYPPEFQFIAKWSRFLPLGLGIWWPISTFPWLIKSPALCLSTSNFYTEWLLQVRESGKKQR